VAKGSDTEGEEGDEDDPMMDSVGGGAAYGSDYDAGGLDEKPEKKPKPLNLGGGRGGRGRGGGGSKCNMAKIMKLIQDPHDQDKEAEATREKAEKEARKQEPADARAQELKLFKLLMGKGNEE
jgi:hypothetical protein